MIQHIIDRFQEIKPKLLKKFEKEQPSSYEDILVQTLNTMYDPEDEIYNIPDVSNLTTLNHGDYQGTLVFIMPENVYLPNKYYIVKVFYGSCSECDTFYSYAEMKNSAPHMVTLALHMMEAMKEI